MASAPSENDGIISVQYGPTNDVYDALMAANNSCADVLSELESSINQLLSATWEGMSADAWSAIQNGWNLKIQDMNADLASNAGILQEMTTNYSTTDNNLAMQWSEITLA
jgi:WXG100 family type VII secretion target